ncbi:hypothetical protein C8T65DRAFT_735644 [Cerioporus squamosus]|nr:hypothetical protein C8T65DRAFT_735644 [Cerioporus squamosus]
MNGMPALMIVVAVVFSSHRSSLHPSNTLDIFFVALLAASLDSFVAHTIMSLITYSTRGILAVQEYCGGGNVLILTQSNGTSRMTGMEVLAQRSWPTHQNVPATNTRSAEVCRDELIPGAGDGCCDVWDFKGA